jgi:hypothetical protein
MRAEDDGGRRAALETVAETRRAADGPRDGLLVLVAGGAMLVTGRLP